MNDIRAIGVISFTISGAFIAMLVVGNVPSYTPLMLISAAAGGGFLGFLLAARSFNIDFTGFINNLFWQGGKPQEWFVGAMVGFLSACGIILAVAVGVPDLLEGEIAIWFMFGFMAASFVVGGLVFAGLNYQADKMARRFGSDMGVPHIPVELEIQQVQPVRRRLVVGRIIRDDINDAIHCQPEEPPTKPQPTGRLKAMLED